MKVNQHSDRLGSSSTPTCSRWHWPRLSSAGSLCPCCTPLPVPQLSHPSPLLLLGFLPVRGLSNWRMSHCPTSACCGDSSKSKRKTEKNNNKHKLHSILDNNVMLCYVMWKVEPSKYHPKVGFFTKAISFWKISFCKIFFHETKKEILLFCIVCYLHPLGLWSANN